MVELSPSGVCYDLANTPFIFERNGIEYHFSSITHRNKFIRDITIREEWLSDSLSRRFNATVNCSVLAGLQLYSQIEKRGYYIILMDKMEVCTCRGNVQVNMTI